MAKIIEQIEQISTDNMSDECGCRQCVSHVAALRGEYLPNEFFPPQKVERIYQLMRITGEYGLAGSDLLQFHLNGGGRDRLEPVERTELAQLRRDHARIENHDV